MNREEEITKFLQLIYHSKLNNININEDMVYSNLVKINVKERGMINGYFDYWVDHFKNSFNIRVFVADYWKYFCQFVNNKKESKPSYNKIKIYIPLDKEHIKLGASLIFDYMKRENISHLSKIGSEVRVDDIVIRLDSFEDINKLREYITRNNYIMEGLIKPNPFTYNDGVISYAWDGHISYNSTISALISDYIVSTPKNTDVKEINYRNFYKFILDKYKKVFISKTELDDFINEFNIDPIDKEQALCNYRCVFETIISELDSKNGINEFKEQYYKNIDTNYQEEIMYSFNEDNKVENETDIYGIWQDCYDKLVSKYGILETTIRIIRFIETGNTLLFTREYGIRTKIKDNHITPDILKSIIENSDYFNNKREYLYNASINTINKYGTNQLVSALYYGGNGDFNYFTNDFDSRSELILNVDKSEILSFVLQILMLNGYNMNSIIDKLSYGIEDSDIVEIYEIYANMINNNKNKTK